MLQKSEETPLSQRRNEEMMMTTMLMKTGVRHTKFWSPRKESSSRTKNEELKRKVPVMLVWEGTMRIIGYSLEIETYMNRV